MRDKAKIGQAAGRILARSGVARLFDLDIDEGCFLYHYDEATLDCEGQLLAGRYVLTTSLRRGEASAAEVLGSHRRLLEVESAFRVLKYFIKLRPVYHWTEQHIRAHVAVCVIGAVIETDLRHADVRDHDDQPPRDHAVKVGSERSGHRDPDPKQGEQHWKCAADKGHVDLVGPPVRPLRLREFGPSYSDSQVLLDPPHHRIGQLLKGAVVLGDEPPRRHHHHGERCECSQLTPTLVGREVYGGDC